MAEKKRLIEKEKRPTKEDVQFFIGDIAWQRLMCFENMLLERYELNRELKFPFGNEYGWGFRYAHRKTLLLYVFFDENSFCCTISINDKASQKVEDMLADLSPEIQTAWKNRYPCGVNGGWIHYSVSKNEELLDLVRLMSVKVKPKKSQEKDSQKAK